MESFGGGLSHVMRSLMHAEKISVKYGNESWRYAMMHGLQFGKSDPKREKALVRQMRTSLLF
jgi:hypothetical protein